MKHPFIIGTVSLGLTLVGCGAGDDSLPEVCPEADQVELMSTTLAGPADPSDEIIIDDATTVFVAVTDDPISRQDGRLMPTVSNVYARPSAAEPGLRESMGSVFSSDHILRFDDLESYEAVDLEPGSYQLYALSIPADVRVVRCRGRSGSE